MEILFRILLTLFLFSPVSTQAKTLSAGYPSSVPPLAPSNFLENSDEEETPWDQIHSEQVHKIKAGLKEIKKSPVSFFTKDKKGEKLAYLINLLCHDSEIVRSLAQNILKSALPHLITEGKITEDTASEYSKRAHATSQGLRHFVAFIQILLSSPDSARWVRSEHFFQILTALTGHDSLTRKIAGQTLSQNAPTIAASQVWTSVHSRDFVDKFLASGSERHDIFFKVFNRSVVHWAEAKCIDPKSIQQVFAARDILSREIASDMAHTLADPKNATAFKELGLFSREWAESFLKDILENPHTKDQTLSTLSQLIPAFADAGGFTKDDFTKLWKYLLQDISSFSEPFVFITENLEFLSKKGWFSGNLLHEALLLHKQLSSADRKKILRFVDTNFAFLSSHNWLEATALRPWLLEKTENPRDELPLMKILSSHAELITQHRLFTREDVEYYSKLILSEDNEISALAIQIFKTGFKTWCEQAFLNPENLSRFIQLDPARENSAVLLQVFTDNFALIPMYFSQQDLEKMATYLLSPHAKVKKAAKEFFSKHYELARSLYKKNLSGVVKIAKRSQNWEELKPIFGPSSSAKKKKK